MASRGAGIGWFFVGFIAGVAATLAVIIFATRPQPTRIPVQGATAPAAPVVSYRPPAAPEASVAPAVATASAPPPASSDAPPKAAADEQTQEDAAAAGMTSRARPGG